MGPNQNINMSGTGVAGAAPAQSTPAASSENIMAQGVSEKKKGGKGMLYGMILCAVLAVGGIGFGVWAWMDGDTQVKNSNMQITDLKAQNAELLEQVNNNVGEEIIDENSPNIGTANYIYVGEWGLKIRIADSLEMVTYEYDYGDGYAVLRVSGATKDGQSIPDFAKIEKCKLGSVSRYSQANVEAGIVPSWYADPFMSDDEYSYYYEGPQSLCTETQDYAQWESDTAAVINNMLVDADNYSKI